MPRLVTKFGYIRPGKHQSPGGYARYIATREGVECIDDSHKYDPATQAQKHLIRRILQDFPHMEQSPAYQAYSREPTRGWASSFISCSLQENGEQITRLKTYADYIATRPGAERFGTHGLFTDEGEAVHLSRVSRELNQYPGRVYTGILSLTREDAQRLGFESGSRWRDFLRGHRQTLAEQFKIPPGHLKWYAAFHNASHHPHVHLIVYSEVPGEGHLSKQGVENLRSALARDIFSQDLLCTYQRQTGYRDKLRQESRAQIEKIVEEINRGSCENTVVRMLILEIAQQLSRTSGKKVYGYLKPETKALVDSVVAELAKDERIQTLYDLWYTQREDVLRTYTDTFPERIPLERNPEFKAIHNAVIQEAMKAVSEGPVTMPLRTSLPNDEDKDDKEKDGCKTVRLKTEIDSAAPVFEPIQAAGPVASYEAAGRLLCSLARMIQTKTQAEEKEMAALDRKQRQLQAHKKQAMGIRG